MKTTDVHFDQMNEADVREEILAPLLDRLGYRSGTDGNVSRERPLALRYPRFSLGRKKPKADPYLRGRADYVLEVKGHARWVLEAKPPNEEIDQDAIEQAWSYANHTEVRAVYFVVSNGRRFLVFRSSAPPEDPPLIDLDYENILNKFVVVAGVLSVDAIRRDFSDIRDLGKPIGAGLRSIAKIASGAIVYTDSSIPIPAIYELQAAVVDGSVERGEHGNLFAYVVVQAPLKSVQEMIERMGLSRLEYVSTSDSLSSDPHQPTNFVYEGHATFAAGEELFDISSGRRVRIEETIECDILSRVSLHLAGTTVSGAIVNQATYSKGLDFDLSFSGNVTIRLV